MIFNTNILTNANNVRDSKEILADLLDYLKISANKFAFEIGLKANTSIYHIKNGRNRISPELAKKITAKYSQINYNWLLTGEGEMLKESAAEPSRVEEPGAAYSNLLQEVHADIKKDLHELSAGMEKNLYNISQGIFDGLKDQRKILRFIEGLDAKKISRATEELDEFLKQKK